MYTILETIQKLQSDEFHYQKWFGRGADKKLKYADKILYESVMYHTNWYPHRINLTGRLKLLVECKNNKKLILCKCGQILKYHPNEKRFVYICKNCKPRSNSLEWFLIRYGEESGEEKFKSRRLEIKRQRQGFMSLPWFVGKYGQEEGQKRYNIHYEKIFQTREQNGQYSYSLISQELFWLIMNKLTKTEKQTADIRFYTYNNKREQRINLNKEDKIILKDLNRVTMFVDFKFNNKIIEFDGTYWHNDREDHDKKRDLILKQKGYEVLHIPENEFKQNQDMVITNCLEFLRS